MLDQRFFQELSERLASLMPMAGDLRDELRTRIEQQVQASFAGLDILSRTEFEQQMQSLERARQRIEELELRLQELERQVKAGAEPSGGSPE